MLRVILADDEFLVRLAFINTINWKERGFELVGTASNGVEAYEMILRERPDIVITDLTMPQMSGLELIERVKAEGIPCEFVVLSCHNEFDYVKQALKLGVFDYILKLSMDMNELLEMLERLKKKILENRPNTGSGKEPFTWQELGDTSFLVIVAGSETNDEEGQDKTRAQIMSFLEQMTASIHEKSIFVYNNMPILLLWEQNTDVRHLLADTKEEIEKYLGIQAGFGVGEWVVGNAKIKKSFEEAVSAYKNRFFKGEYEICFFEELHYADSSAVSFGETFPDVAERLRQGIGKEFREYVSEQIEKLKKEEKLEPDTSRMYLHELLVRIKMELEKYGKNAALEEEYSDLYKQINELEYLEDIRQDFVYFLDRVMERLEVSEENEIVHAAKKYVREHLAEDLRVAWVSHSLGVSADYMSHLFKVETGIRFIDYVNHVRTEYACDRLRGTEDKIYEIGEESGFENTNYFIKVFKKYTGMTPSDFRKRESRKDI